MTLAPGETTKTFTVTIKGDKQKERNEYFDVVLSGASNAHLPMYPAYGTILNDDGGGKGSGKGNQRLSIASAFDAAIDDWYTTTKKKHGR